MDVQLIFTEWLHNQLHHHHHQRGWRIWWWDFTLRVKFFILAQVKLIIIFCHSIFFSFWSFYSLIPHHYSVYIAFYSIIDSNLNNHSSIKSKLIELVSCQSKRKNILSYDWFFNSQRRSILNCNLLVSCPPPFCILSSKLPPPKTMCCYLKHFYY